MDDAWFGTRNSVTGFSQRESPIRAANTFCCVCAAASFLQLAFAYPAPAQILQGQVREDGSGIPIPAAFLVLLDQNERQVAAALSDSTGRFRLRAPRAGSYVLRLERLGYRSSDSPAIQLITGGTRDYDWSVPVEAIPLAAIHAIVESDRCQVRPARIQELAAAWDEARKALALVAWTSDEGIYEFQIARYTREYDFDSGSLVRQIRGSESGVSRSSPFVGRSPEELVEEGFARFEADSIHYYGPDATVLLSDAFLSTHCFRLGKPPEDHPAQIPLHFEPSRPSGRSDIRGTIWLTAQDGRLNAVDFTFTALPRWADGRRAEGRVEFEELESGAWIVRRWWIRGPTLGGLAPPSDPRKQVLQRLPGEPDYVTRERPIEVPTVLERGAEVVQYNTVGATP